MVYKAALAIKNIFVNSLREIFKTNYAKVKTSDGNVIADYTYTSQKQTTKIDVYRQYPEVVPKIPIIIVTTTTGIAPIVTYFGDELIDDRTNNDQQETIGGKFNFTINLDIIAETTVDRDNVVDIITTNLIYLSRTIFAETYDLFVENIVFGAETQRDFGGRYLHTQSIGFNIYTEWTENIDLSQYQALNKIDLTITVEDF